MLLLLECLRVSDLLYVVFLSLLYSFLSFSLSLSLSFPFSFFLSFSFFFSLSSSPLSLIILPIIGKSRIARCQGGIPSIRESIRSTCDERRGWRKKIWMGISERRVERRIGERERERVKRREDDWDEYWKRRERERRRM